MAKENGRGFCAVIVGAWFVLAGIIAEAASDWPIGQPLNSPSRDDVIEAVFAETPDQWPWEVIEIPGFFVYARNPGYATHFFCQLLHVAIAQMHPLLPAESILPANGDPIHVVFAGIPTTADSWRILGNPGAVRGKVFVIADPPIREVPVRASFVVNHQIKKLQLASLLARLSKRTLGPPDWLINGLENVVQSVVASDTALWLPAVAVAAGDVPALLSPPVRIVTKEGSPTSQSVEFPPRPSSGVVVAYPPGRNVDATRTHLEIPMSAVLKNPGLESKRDRSAAPTQGWQFFQSVLFVRWALGQEEARRDAFWQFARAACDGPVTDAMVQDQFGMSFDDLDRLLNATLLAQDGWLTAVEIPLDRTKIHGLPRIETRLATDAEIKTLKRELTNQPTR